MIVDQFPEVLNSAKGDGATPLHVAVRNGKESMVECILHNMAKYRFDVDARLKSGETALHIACAEGFLSVIKLLIEHGADMNAEVHEGNTAVSMCVIKHKLLANLPQQLQGNELRPDLRTVSACYYSPILCILCDFLYFLNVGIRPLSMLYFFAMHSFRYCIGDYMSINDHWLTPVFVFHTKTN